MRYHTADGSNPKVEASFHVMGPQDEDQIPPEVVALLAKPQIKKVYIEYDWGPCRKITVYQPLPDEV